MIHSQEYDFAYRPSLPVVEIVVENKVNGLSEKLTAIVDSGADGSFLPAKVVRRLKVKHNKTRKMRGVSGVAYSVKLYGLNLSIGPIRFGTAQSVGDEQGQVILGRNVLNWLHVTLDSLGQMMTINDE